VEEENQLITKINTSECIYFIRYEDFKEFLVDKKIITPLLKINSFTENKRLISIMSFVEAHIGSYFNTFNKGYNYFLANNTLDLMEWRRKGYENDIEEWFIEINDICKQFNIKYIWNYTDLEKYFIEFLAYKYNN
jgi:hypothetical protein